jgi:predicted nuclease of predicted toxin-antitoxin system
MKVLIDMNLSPEWVATLERHEHLAVHWSAVGDARATDRTIMEWAAERGYNRLYPRSRFWDAARRRISQWP